MLVGFLEKNYRLKMERLDNVMQDFIGTWHLVDWKYFVDDVEVTFWENPSGILLYTKEAKMSAILMQSNRKPFKSEFLSKGSDEEKIEAIDSYISYAGDFSIDGNRVYHHVHFSLFPNWMETDLIRNFEFSNQKQQLTLSTLPQVAPNGKSIKNILIWKKV
jgi:hypothetical protein